MEMQRRLKETELEDICGGIEVYDKDEYRPGDFVFVNTSEYCSQSFVTIAYLICEENGEKYYYVLPFKKKKGEETIIPESSIVDLYFR